MSYLMYPIVISRDLKNVEIRIWRSLTGQGSNSRRQGEPDNLLRGIILNEDVLRHL